MEDLKVVVLDAYGGDNAPVETVKGAVMALNQEKSLKIIITGYKEEILKELEKYNYDKDRLEIVNTTEVITCNDTPTLAIRQKKDSSLVVAFRLLKERQDVISLVSAGSTGAILTGGFLMIGRLKGVSRPALAPLLPTLKGTQTLLIDCGANADVKPLNLCHFALMGNEYMKSIGVENPRIALLSVGTEEEKGNELVKKTLPIMKTLPINFVGNMEARDLLSGNYDVVVCDGFSGNVLLKGTEGGIIALKSILKQEIKSSLMCKIGALFMKKAFKGMKQKLNYEANGGSPFVGCKKLILKCHGSAEAESVCNTILSSLQLEKVNLNQRIEKVIEETKIEITEE